MDNSKQFCVDIFQVIKCAKLAIKIKKLVQYRKKSTK